MYVQECIFNLFSSFSYHYPFSFLPLFFIDEDKKTKQFSLMSRLLFTEGFVTLSQTEI